MKNVLRLIGLLLLIGGSAVAGTIDWFSIPIILTKPRTVNFGSVRDGTVTTNTFVIENVGGGRLVGTATVEPPFKIVSGADYSLKHGSAQIVTVIYEPSGGATDERTIKCTGGGGAKVGVVGKLSTRHGK